MGAEPAAARDLIPPEISARLECLDEKLQKLSRIAVELDRPDPFIGAILEVSYGPMVMIHHGQIVEANVAAAKLFGVSDPMMLVGAAPADLVVEEDRKKVDRRVGQGVSGEYRVTLERPDGMAVPVLVRATNVRVNGDAIRLTAIREVDRG